MLYYKKNKKPARKTFDWFFIFFSLLCKVLLLLIFGLFSNKILSQCKADIFFRQKITEVYNNTKKSDSEKLKALLDIIPQIENKNLIYDSAYFFLLQKAGILFSRQHNDYSNAIAFTEKSLTYSKAIKNCSFDRIICDDYYNLYYFNLTNKFWKKHNACDSFISYCIKANYNYNLSESLLEDEINNLFNQGKYSLQVEYCKLAELITRKFYHGKDSLEYINNYIVNLANALHFTDPAAAKKDLQITLTEYEKIGLTKSAASLYGLTGLIDIQLQKYPEAIKNLQKSYKLNLADKYFKGCAQKLAIMGELYAIYFQNDKKGLILCDSGLKLADNNDSLLIFQKIANIYTLKKEFVKSQYFYQQAFNTIQYNINEEGVLKNTFQFPGFNELQSISDLITAKADTYVQQYQFSKDKKYLTSAINVYRKNDLFLEKIKIDQRLDLASNLVWKTTARNLYEHAIEACHLDNNVEDAFYFFEKSRAVLLNDQLNELRNLNNADIAKLAALKKTIAGLNKKLNTIPVSSDEYLAVSKNLYFKNEQLEQLSDSIKNKNAAYQKNSIDTSFISIGQLQEKALNNSKALLEVFYGDSSVYVLSIANNNKSLVKINKSVYDSLTNSFISFIHDPVALNNHYKDFIKTSHQLYSLLFQQLSPSYGSIIISPDGKGYPFEALVTNNDENYPRYFLNDHATSYTYSAKYLLNQFAANTSSSNNIMGVAPVQYTNNQNLSALSGSDVSLQTINTYFSNAKNYVFNSATKGNFLQNFPDYNIIQLYAHASDNSANNDPVIYFSDSALYLSSLVPDRKAVVTQLVVLSACETANGKLYEGEGIFSFNRGFAAFGIPAAISNLWSVDNKSTYKITELFYKYLSQGLPMDMALQKAKLEFINTATSEQNKLPYYWAGVILTGKVAVIKSGANFPWILLSMVTFLLLLIAYIIRKNFIKKTEIN